jgi:outer membrane receptor protein involved in Fe transport
VYTENDTTLEISGPNPNLKPQYATNYTGRLSYYFGSASSVSASAFENNFQNFVQTRRIPGAAADVGFTDPIFANYTLTTKDNLPGTVTYRGATLDYSHFLTFLPRDLRGTRVFANYTRTYIIVKLPDPAGLHASTPYNFGWLPGVSPNVVNYGIDVPYKRLKDGIKAKWTDKTAYTSTYNTWMKQTTKIDVDFSYRLTDKVSIFFYARNLFNVRDYNYANNNPQQIASNGRGIEYYGAYLYSGIRGRF